MSLHTFIPPISLPRRIHTRIYRSTFPTPTTPLPTTKSSRLSRPPRNLPRHPLYASAAEHAEDFDEVQSLDDILNMDHDLTPEELQLCGQFPPDIPMINKLVLVGRLGRDPEIKTVGNDLQVCRFSLAVPNEYDPDEGPDQDRTSWFDVEAWGRLAQYIAANSRKGMRVGVTGSFGMNQWTGRDGQLRNNYIVTANTFEVLQSRSEHSDTWAQPNTSATPPYKQKEKVEQHEEFIDLPF